MSPKIPVENAAEEGREAAAHASAGRTAKNIRNGYKNDGIKTDKAGGGKSTNGGGGGGIEEDGEKGERRLLPPECHGYGRRQPSVCVFAPHTHSKKGRVFTLFSF